MCLLLLWVILKKSSLLENSLRPEVIQHDIKKKKQQKTRKPTEEQKSERMFLEKLLETKV